MNFLAGKKRIPNKGWLNMENYHLKTFKVIFQTAKAWTKSDDLWWSEKSSLGKNKMGKNNNISNTVSPKRWDKIHGSDLLLDLH